MQFPDGANRRKLKNRVISTIRFQYLKYSQGNCMRNRWTPLCLPPEKSHVIPSGPHSATARKPRNFNDPISIFERSSGELRAKLLCPSAAGPGHTRTKSRPIRGSRDACGQYGHGCGTRARRQGQGAPQDQPRRAKLAARTASGQATRRPEIRRATSRHCTSG